MARKFYKYRPFNQDCVKFLAGDQIYYSDPEQFNDPMDSRITIDIDVNLSEFEKLYYNLMIKIGSKNSDENYKIREARYYATEHTSLMNSHEYNSNYMLIIKHRIKNIVKGILSKYGIFCLSQRWNSPLMWSHYADEHRGICVELTLLSEASTTDLRRVNYKKSNPIKASELIDWIANDSDETLNKIRGWPR